MYTGTNGYTQFTSTLWEIFGLLANGDSTVQIARRTGATVNTVRGRISIMRKLAGARTIAHLIALKHAEYVNQSHIGKNYYTVTTYSRLGTTLVLLVNAESEVDARAKALKYERDCEVIDVIKCDFVHNAVEVLCEYQEQNDE